VKLTITRGGGLGGIPATTVLDGARLSPGDARRLGEEVHAIVPADPPARRLPDETLYRLTVADGEPVEASYTDQTLPEDVRRLIAWVDEHPQREELPLF
jgi:hypothetical protein